MFSYSAYKNNSRLSSNGHNQVKVKWQTEEPRTDKPARPGQTNKLNEGTD